VLDDLIIYQKAYDFLLWLHPVVNKFSQSERFIKKLRRYQKMAQNGTLAKDDVLAERFLENARASWRGYGEFAGAHGLMEKLKLAD